MTVHILLKILPTMFLTGRVFCVGNVRQFDSYSKMNQFLLKKHDKKEYIRVTIENLNQTGPLEIINASEA